MEILLFNNQGFIKRLDENCAGSDLTVVNAARVSFGKESKEFSNKDAKLINYLAEHKHMSPFRHPQLSFHLKAPEMLMRQAYKHIVGIAWTSDVPPVKDHAWNEISGRYVIYDSIYEPGEFRPQAEDNKQASKDGNLADACCGKLTVRDAYKYCIDICKETYNELLKSGVSKEQARLCMPFATFTEVIWTCSLEAIIHFVKLRTHSGAQYEIRELADAVAELTKEKFPQSFEALMKYCV